ncbi:MAG: right-handed parallel beta-helix repeat-containing protein [Candidatus Freyrarchaeum guaymaensis]
MLTVLIAVVGFANVQTNGSKVPYWYLFLNQNAGQDGYTNIPVSLKDSSVISVGMEYYLPFADNTTHGDYLYSRLYLFSPTNTTVRIDSDNDDIFETVLNVTENTETVYNYPIAGSHIVSDHPVLIYYRHQSDDWGAYDDQAFTYTLLPVSVLGVDYYLPSSPTIISMVATQSDTSIQIDTNNDGTPEASYSGLGPGDVRNYTNPPAGTHVTSNNPVYVVAVNYDWGGEDSTYIYSVLPTERLGTDYWFNIDYKTLRYNQVSNSSAIHIVATQDNTQLYINLAGYSLNAGETVSYSFDNGSVHITSDKPVGAAYIFNVYATDPWDGDRHYAHAMSLTPTSQLGTEYHRAYYVVATHDNTRVDIDGDHDGVFENTTYLNAGEAINTFYVKSHPTNPDLVTNETGHIRANYPVLSYFVLVGDYQGTDECTWMYTMLPSVGVGFDYPMYVAINGSGYVYATDTHNHRVLVFDAEGNLVSSWGSFGAGDEQFAWPHGIAVNATGYVYVADTYHHKIKVFDANGNYVNSWGSQGSGAGEFFYPHGIGVNGSGYVYVADWMNERICVFDANGNFIRSWGGLYQPRDVKVNASGYVYVADTYNHIMKIYDANGNYIKSFGSFYNPFGVAINGSGYVYVSDTSNHIIKVYDANGNFVDSWGTKGSGEEQFRYPRGVAVNDSGYVYVVDWGNDRIQVFDADGNYVNSWGAKSCEYSQFFHPVGVAVNGSGYVYVTDEVRERVCIFDRDGRFIRGWGLSKPWGIDVNNSGYVYVANIENHSIQIYDADGNFVESWGSQGSGAGQFQSPYGIAINGSGYVYVADSGNQRIQVFDPSGNYITSWGSYGSGNGQFIWPRGIAVNGSGYVYVADTSNHRVQVFDPSGNFVESWGGFFYPWDVAVNATGHVYVADTGNHRVRVFDAEGNLVAGWGSLGTEFDQLYAPRGIAVNGSGYVYVDDGANHRLCVFDPSGEFLTSWRDTFNVSIVDNTPPQVTITTPADDYTVNTGTIYIIGEYDGTGSSITSILCNDSRFTLQSSVPMGSVSGTYTFSNNTFIPNGSFYIEITVQDSARLKSTAIRRILVGQSISTTTWENKTVTGSETYSNVEIILNGNLTIASGGSLTLTNVTLRINCTANGSNHIEVQSGGALYINDTDGNPATKDDATIITALNPSCRYLFWVRNGAIFQMNNSELSYCGYLEGHPYSSGGLWINTNDAIIENNTLTNNHYGIILYYAHHNTMRSNNATNNTRDGFFLYSSNNNTLSNNTATNNGNDGFELYYSSNNTFSNNTAADNGGDGLDMYGSDNNSFTNNLAQNNTGNGFWIDGDFNSFIGNTAINNGHGFLLIFALNNTLVNNIAEKNRGCGFYPSSSTDNTSLTGNIAKDNLRDGFEMHGSNSYFYNNEAINNSEYGFDFLVGPHFVSNNTANNNHWGGFRIYSNHNTLVNNKANNNTQYGFILWKANNNNLSSNEAINNGIYGFYLYNSTDNELPGNTAINNSVHGFYLDSLSTNNDLTGSLEKNYVQVELRDLLNNLPVQGAEVKIEVDGETIYASPGFGGTNSTTDINGLTGWILVPYRKFISGTVFVENETKVTLSYTGLYIVNNSRIVSVSTSHTETFFVDNVPPSVTITTPWSDTVTNFGPIYILGHFNGTGSRVQNIFCNDSRFDLLSSDLSEVGTFSFVNNTAIPTGDFWVNITVQDESGLVVFMFRHVVVNQTLAEASVTTEIDAGLNQRVDFSMSLGVELTLDLNAPISVSVVKTTENVGGGVPSGFVFLGRYVSIVMNDTTAIQGLTIVIHYTDQEVAELGLSESSLSIWYWDESSGNWVKLPSTVDRHNNIVTAYTEHLTLFAILGTPTIPGAPISPYMPLLLFLSVPSGLNPLVYLALGLVAVALVTVAVIARRRGREERVPVGKGEAVIPRAPAPEEKPPVREEREEEKRVEEEAVPVRRCPFCGNEVSAGEKTCPKCGGVLL